jgi:hypothetical protein
MFAIPIAEPIILLPAGILLWATAGVIRKKLAGLKTGVAAPLSLPVGGLDVEDISLEACRAEAA